MPNQIAACPITGVAHWRASACEDAIASFPGPAQLSVAIGTVKLVSCPARARLPARNGLVNEVEFLGLITQNG